ncbi:DNA-binding transcriptional regulator [Escherichia coli]|uniref:DNA-binding transcriptional regulator n=1 Tax=Escherichia coli TaxID=562 RepID=A0A376MID8_ECOLX|nr:DNA-binding transcriptional regulator [Escherichia coli]
MQRTDLTFSPALKKLMDQVRKKVTIRCINRQRFAEEMQILREISTLAGSTTGDLCRLPNMNSRLWAINLNIWCRTI